MESLALISISIAAVLTIVFKVIIFFNNLNYYLMSKIYIKCKMGRYVFKINLPLKPLTFIYCHFKIGCILMNNINWIKLMSDNKK